MIERDLVFIGGGHTHALVLRMLAMRPIDGVRLTLITDTLLTPYSGMLPGYIAGHYSFDDIHIDLHRLARAGQVRLIHDRVTGLDLQRKTIMLQNHAPLGYDKLSINTGSTPNLTLPGAREFAVGVKPVSQLTAVWQGLLQQEYHDRTPHWAIVGAGAAGVEMALAIQHRFTSAARPIRLSLVFAGAQPLAGYTDAARQRAERHLKLNGIELVANFRVAEVTASALINDNGDAYPIDQSIWCTPASAPQWPGKAGLATDAEGFIAVNEYLQSTSHNDVFACGDVSAMLDDPRPKAGVFAVRSAPFLVKNLRASFAQTPMTKVRLQTDFLSLIALGEQRAIGQRNGLAVAGKWLWRWKDRIDRKFMRLFDEQLPNMTGMSDEPMHCAGCGSKIGPQLLSDTLQQLPLYPRPELAENLDQAEDAALAMNLNNRPIWQSIDGFRAFTDDLYRLGIVATHHAINDCYAMGIEPVSAQVWANLAFAHPRLIKRDFQQLMAGVCAALLEHQTTLVGGHSTEGAETHLALVVNGAGDGKWRKNTLRAGDWLLLNRPLGSGIALAAEMQGRANARLTEALWRHLLTSNRDFFLALQSYDVHAATDVTGFGLLGHVLEMTQINQCQVRLNSSAIPLLDGVLALSRQGVASTLLPQLQPLLYEVHCGSVEPALIHCLLDPQTQGGLLVAASAEQAQGIMRETGAVKIGEVAARQSDEKAILLL